VIVFGVVGSAKADEGTTTVKAKDWFSWSFQVKSDDIIRWNISTDGPLVDIYMTCGLYYNELKERVALGQELKETAIPYGTGVNHSSAKFTVPSEHKTIHGSAVLAVYNPNLEEVLLTYKVELEAAEAENVGITTIPILAALTLLGTVWRRRPKT